MQRLPAMCWIIALAGPAVAQTPEPPTPPWANKMFLADIEDDAARAAPVSVTHDFGTVPFGTKLSHTFTITNIYDAPLQVVDIRLSSDCLTAEPPQRVLQPLEKASFIVTMDTRKFKGPNAQIVYVTVGPQHSSTAVLRLTATSRADISLSPPGAIDFGVVPAGTNPSKTLTLEYSGNQRDWKVTGVLPPAGPISVEVAPAEAGRFTVTGTLRGDAIAGDLIETVNLTTNDPASPVVPVTVRAAIQPPVEAKPDRVTATDARVGEVFVMTLSITGNSVKPFKVDPVQDAGDGVSVETLGTLSPIHRVTLRFAPIEAGPFRKEVHIRTSLNGGTTVTVVLDANVLPAKE